MRIRRKFTLVELLIVITVIGVLIAFLNPVRTPSADLLDFAALDGDVIEARRLIENSLGNVNRHGNMGRTPLHYAASHGHKDVAELLIEKGAEVDAKDIRLETPLHYAVCSSYDVAKSHCGQIDVVRLLVANGADPNAKDKEGRTPLSYAEDAGYGDIAALLIAHGADK
jgi:prepilin-type N-terminal cleavage/methylation domain-containing protein